MYFQEYVSLNEYLYIIRYYQERACLISYALNFMILLKNEIMIQKEYLNYIIN